MSVKNLQDMPQSAVTGRKCGLEVRKSQRQKQAGLSATAVEDQSHLRWAPMDPTRILPGTDWHAGIA